MPFFTPDKTAGNFTGGFTIPAYFLPYVVGAILEACIPENWVVKGDATVEECTDAMVDLISQLEGD